MKQTELFKNGEIVQLKSGGPKMTVISEAKIPGVEWVECAWFAGSKHERASFPPDALQRPEPAEKKTPA